MRTNLQDRMRILNAYYLPDGGEEVLYPSISPVNTFRLILNYYFGTSYPLLDDTAYHSGYETALRLHRGKGFAPRLPIKKE